MRVLRDQIKRARREEDGSLIIFGLFMFILILWLGGMAVDLMRFETTRAKLQGTLDRATLAAADLDQTLPPADVVRDYFTKAGMIQFLQGEPVVKEGLNYRVVSATAEAKMPLFFYDIPRVLTAPFTASLTTLDVSGTSTAEERVTDVEVSLVLDISSSMSRDNRMTNLRPAAQTFVSTVLGNNTNAPEGLITISMVPYSSVVNPGEDIADEMRFNRAHFYSSCALFPTSIFSTTELDLSQRFDHVAHFDIDEFGDYGSYFNEGWCFEGDKNAIIPATADVNLLHDAIRNLEPYGNTAIDMGVKWGVGLLDPSTRGLISTLAGEDGTGVPEIADGRPYEYTQPDVLKVLVLMTDGENTSQWDLHDRFKYERSFLWFDMPTPDTALKDVPFNRTSVQYKGLGTPNDFTDDRFYWNGYSGVNYDTSDMSRGRFRNYPNGFTDANDYRVTMVSSTTGNGVANGVGPTYRSSVRNVSWQELYANWEVFRVNNQLLSRAYNHGAIPWSAGTSGSPHYIHYDDYIDPDQALNQSVVNGVEADNRLASLCAAARAQGIVIYTVAFEAPAAGQNALRDCASSPSHYFDVAGTDITSAFEAIASDIRALKLTR